MATEQDMAAETSEGAAGEAGRTAETVAGGGADELSSALQEARTRADDYWNQLLRARADLSNQQRRAERELESAHKYGLERFAAELLPVIDGLEMGLSAAGDGDKVDPVKLREGMELTLKLLAAALEKFGIRKVDPAREKFNPALHQAMAVQPSPGVEPNTVVAVYQKGYVLNDRLLRPAMVVVAAAPPASPGAEGKKIDETA